MVRSRGRRRGVNVRIEDTVPLVQGSGTVLRASGSTCRGMEGCRENAIPACDKGIREVRAGRCKKTSSVWGSNTGIQVLVSYRKGSVRWSHRIRVGFLKRSRGGHDA